MNIAFVTREFVSEKNSHDGGLANYLLKISHLIIHENHRPIILVLSNKTEKINYHGIDVYRLNLPSKGIWHKTLNFLSFKLFFSMLNALHESYHFNKYLLKIHAENPIDIIQYANIRGLIFFRPRKIPAVIRCSSYRPLINRFMGGETNFKHQQIEWLEMLGLKKADAIFAPSKLVANAVSHRTKRSVEIIETPFQEIEPSQFDYSILNLIQEKTAGKPYILTYGRLGTWKGTIELANILPEFLKENPDFFYVLIGKDMNYNGKPVINYINEKCKEEVKRVIFYPNVEHFKLFPVISSAHAVVLPSRIENMSNACVESMALGKIVVGANGASFEQLIEHEKNGFLFERMNENDLLQKMNLVAQLSGEKKKQIEEEASLIKHRLAGDRIVKQLLEFYFSAINKKKSG